jgi:protein ImuB
LLKQRVESTHLGYGVERIAITATTVRRVAHEQSRRFDDDAAVQTQREQALGRFVDMVAERFDASAAVQAELVESHIPERAYRWRPFTALPPGEEPPAALPPRPTFIWSRPHPVQIIAIAPDGPPSWLRWLGDGVKVLVSHGPERIAWEWWRDEPRDSRFYGARDYFTVQDERGRWLWLFRHLPTNQWFIHGQWA